MRKILDWNQYIEKAVQAVSEGMVLLKNDKNTLPVKKDEEVAVFGRIQLHYYKSGTGSGGMVNVSEVVGITEGLIRRGATVNQELLDIYKAWDEKNPYDYGEGWGGEPWSQKEMPLTHEVVQKAAVTSKVAFVIIGRTAGEEMDNKLEAGSYLLSEGEKDMLRVVRAHFEKMAVILNVASVLDMSFVDEFKPEAVLYAWQGGMIGGLGTADVLLGNVSPSGKLTDTIAYDVTDYPSHANFGDVNRDFYCEDIYLGYRYFETFAKDRVRYPFGFGLSYTEFALEHCIVSYDGTQVMASAAVKNVGAVAGKEVVQVYLEAPQGKLGKPARVLCGFAKTGLLEPGATEHINIPVQEYDLASYDDSGVTGHPYAYLMEAGEYRFYVGADVRSAAYAGGFLLAEDKVILQVTSAAAPVQTFDRMVNRDGRVAYEPAPLSKIDEAQRRMAAMPAEIPYTGDLGITLAQVVEKKATLEQFIGQLSDEDLACIIRGEGMGSPRVTAGTASAFGGVSKRLDAMGVPAGCCSDGPSGMRLDCGTKAFSLPNGTLLACTFNTALLTELYALVGVEMTANNVDCLLGPGMNIHRHPLNGRNFEYFSEDPFVTGKIAAAQLKGLHSAGVTGTIKHFCANNQETGRHTIDSVVSERALREIYLRGFEIAVKEGKAQTIMTTYGSLNGLWTCSNFDLVTTILRKEWGFTGFAMTDWWANINRRGQGPDKSDFAAMAMAQNDVYMVCADSEDHEDNTLESLKKGELQRAELQRNAANVLGFLMTTHAMKRRMNTADEVEIINRPDEATADVGEVKFYELDEELVVDLRDVNTDRGRSHSFVLDTRVPGRYAYTITASSTQSELAQIPVSLISLGTVSGTFTWNGTGGKPVSFHGEIPIFSKYNAIRLFFAQSGLNLIDIRFTRVVEE